MFIIILGPPAVGKMTVGHELSKKINLKVFHNHLIIDALLPLFDFNSFSFKKLNQEFRTKILEEIIDSPTDGIIFTFVAAYNSPTAIPQLKEWIKLFKKNNHDVYIIELEASFEERLKRNETPHRLSHKYSKRDIKNSREVLLKNEREWDMVPRDGFWDNIPYLKLNTENLSASETAEIIIKHFKFRI